MRKHQSPRALSTIGPSFAECRRAARSVKKAEHGRQALAYLRPRDASGLQRERPPLALLLYLLGRQNLLVWRSPDELVALRPPYSDPMSTMSGKRYPIRLVWLDRWWNYLTTWLPPFLVMLLVIPLAFVPELTLAGLLIMLVAGLLYPLAVVLAMFLRGLLSVYRRIMSSGRGTDNSETLLIQNWSVSLCHTTDPTKVPDLLHCGYQHALDTLVAGDPERSQHTTVTLVWNERCMTTPEARAAARATAHVTPLAERGADLLILRTPDDSSTPSISQDLPDLAGLVSVIVLAVAGFIAFFAHIVSDQESAACEPQCEGRPASYGTALYWLLGRLIFFSDSGDVSPASVEARVLGFTMPLMGVVLLGIIIQGIVSTVQTQRKDAQELAEKVSRALATTTKAAWGNVFINYRQGADELAIAGLHRELADRLGPDKVFFDIRSIPPGARYPDELRDKLERTTVFLAVIHRDWLSSLRQRRDAPGTDWVRFEISTALRVGLTVIPVPFNDVPLPLPSELPPDIAELVHRQVCRLRWTSYDEDMNRLISVIESRLRVRS